MLISCDIAKLLQPKRHLRTIPDNIKVGEKGNFERCFISFIRVCRFNYLGFVFCTCRNHVPNLLKRSFLQLNSVWALSIKV